MIKGYELRECSLGGHGVFARLHFGRAKPS